MAAIYEDEDDDVKLLQLHLVPTPRGHASTKPPPPRRVLDRWAVLALSLLSYSGLGFGDTFGLYSASVKDNFNLTQDELDSIAMAGFWPNLAGVALVPGLVNDRWGGRITMVGAAIFIFIGLTGFWATLTGRMSVWRCGPVLQLAVFEAVRSFGNQWPSAAMMPTNMKNFAAQPAVSTRMMAVLKCIGSVGGAVASQVFVAFISPAQEAYVLFAAIAAPTLCLFGAPFLRVCPASTARSGADDAVDLARLNKTFGLLAGLVPGVAAIAYIDQVHAVSTGVTRILAIAIIVVFVLTALSPAVLPRWWFRKRGPENSDDDVTRTEELTAMVPGGINNAVASECDAIPDTEPLDWQTCRTPRDRTPWQVLQTAECWLMFWSTWVTLGAYGIVALNLAQVCEANGKKSAVAFCVTLTMVAAACGRIGSAFLFGLATSRGWACTWTLFASNALILAAMLLLATGSAVGLYLGVVLSGAVYGGYWTLLPLCMAELYGLANLGANYKIMTVAEAIGYLVVGRLLAARVYEDHIAEGDGNTCLGPDCFRETLMIAAGLLLSGALASIWLSLRVARKHEK